jgi:hypothetical protein
MKRVRRVEREPNPLFRRWLEEFRAEAASRDNKGLVRLYDQCLYSLGESSVPDPDILVWIRIHTFD